MLKVNDIFGPTIQGEGSHSGAVAYFIRMSGCNMWNGKEENKAKSKCPFCDTDFLHHEEMAPDKVVKSLLYKASLDEVGTFVVVISGGEPLLQDRRDMVELITGLQSVGLQVHVETNGTVNPDYLSLFDHVTCSPKLPPEKCKINWEEVDDIKLLCPHPNSKITPEVFNGVLKSNTHLKKGAYLQPVSKNTGPTIEKLYEVGLPWRLSLQVHKYIGVE